MINPRHKKALRVAAAALGATAILLGGVALSSPPADARSGLSPLELAQVEKRNCQVLLANATSSAQRTRAQQCIADRDVIIKALTTTASPTGTTSPSPSASATPTPSPSTTSPSPSPTSPSPSPTTPSPSPTTPSPSPTVTVPPTTPPTGPVLGCMPVPSRCGWPDATNTGVPAGTVLTNRSGKVTLMSGQSLINVNLSGCIQVLGSNTVIRNVRISVTCNTYYAIDYEDAPSNGNNLVENVEIDMAPLPASSSIISGRLGQRSITGSGFTVKKVWWHNGADCVHYSSNVVVQDSFCDLAKIPAGYPGDPHIDGFQSSGGTNVLLKHNTIRNPNGQTAAIINGPDLNVLGPQTNVRIVDNLMTGGGWTVYCDAHSEQGGPVPTSEFHGNRFARGYYTGSDNQGGSFHNRSGQWGPMTDCNHVPAAQVYGNVWDEDNSPIPIA